MIVDHEIKILWSCYKLKFSLIFLKIIKFANIDSNNDGFLNGQKARSLYIYI